MIDIERDVPMKGKSTAGRPVKWIYFMQCADIGYSFFVPDMTPRQIACVRRYWEKRLGWKFKCRTEKKRGKEGVRVWRTA